LDIRGALVADDIVSGTLACANVTISLAGGIEVTGGQGILVDDGADITLDNTDSLDPAKLIFRELDGDAGFEMYSYAYTATFQRSLLLINGTGINTHREFAIHNFEYIELGDDSGMSQLTLGGSTQDHAYLKGLYYVDIESFDAGAAATSGVRISDDAIIAWGTSTGAIFTAAVSKTTYLGGIGADTRFSVKTDGTVGIHNDIIPNVDGSYDLGSSSKKFEQGYINEIYAERVEQSAADAVQVKLSASQSNLTATTWTTVQFNSETNDHTGAFNTSTYTYTAQGDGWRQINLNLYLSGFVTNEWAELKVITSNETFYFYLPARSANDGGFYVSFLAYMDNGDTAYVQIYPITSGNTLDVGATSYFSIFYVND
jgi:hypothetical protein